MNRTGICPSDIKGKTPGYAHELITRHWHPHAQEKGRDLKTPARGSAATHGTVRMPRLAALHSSNWQSGSGDQAPHETQLVKNSKVTSPQILRETGACPLPVLIAESGNPLGTFLHRRYAVAAA